MFMAIRSWLWVLGLSILFHCSEFCIYFSSSSVIWSYLCTVIEEINYWNVHLIHQIIIGILWFLLENKHLSGRGGCYVFQFLSPTFIAKNRPGRCQKLRILPCNCQREIWSLFCVKLFSGQGTKSCTAETTGPVIIFANNGAY